MMMLILSLLCLVFGSNWVQSTANEAKLLVSKKMVNKHLVEKMDLVVEYTIYNIGEVSAAHITLTDRSFSNDKFDLLMGDPAMTLKAPLESGQNFTYVIVLKPLFSGQFNCSPAEVTYSSLSNVQTYIIHSSTPNVITILPFSEYSRKYSSHIFDWIMFTIISLPSLVIPFTLWFNSKKYYDSFNIKSQTN